MKTKITFLLTLILTSALSFSQTRTVFGQPIESVNPANGLIRCVSTEYEKSLQQQYPDRATNEEFEAWIAPKVAAIKQRLMSTESINEVVTIPVVVHVIHNGQAIGTGANITAARVLSQITVLNEDYRKMLDTPGYNDDPVGADVEMEFCMAQVDPDGQPTDGIDRQNKGVASWSTNATVETMKTETQWDPTQYFNIWVVQFTSNSSQELYGTLGYAQFPSESGLNGLNEDGGAANTDGVVIDWHYFGTSDIVTGNFGSSPVLYDKGRTATHEIGHCFGLRHIWGDAGSQLNNYLDCSGTDYCADTPKAGWENYDCLQDYDSCPTSAGNDMTNNYMDYTNDTCMNIFTLDQKARILAVLENSPRRVELVTSNVCTSLGVPSNGTFQGMNVYPNPASDYITVNLGDSLGLPDSYVIYNTLGQTVSAKNVTDISDLKIQTSSLSSGVYFIKVTKDNAQKTVRFMKQ